MRARTRQNQHATGTVSRENRSPELPQLHLPPRSPGAASPGRRRCSLGRHSTPGPPPPAGGRRGRHEQGDSCTTAKVKMAVEDGSATSPKDIRLRPAGAGPAPPWPRRPLTHQGAPPCRDRGEVERVGTGYRSAMSVRSSLVRRLHLAPLTPRAPIEHRLSTC